jgi:ferredoxin-NADP reductase
MRNPLQWQTATLRAHRDLSPSVREFELRPEGGVLPWTVGSHLNVRVPIDIGNDTRIDTGIDAGFDTRSYSLVGLPPGDRADAVYRIAVKRAEPGRGGSRYLWSLDTGAELLIGAPNNHFELGFGAPQYLLVAGGIGITPLVGMALALAQRGAELRMLYAARDASELIYQNVLGAALGTRLQTFIDVHGERLDLRAEIAALRSGAQMVVCGPMALLDAARAAWAAAGRARADLRFETFGNTGSAEAQSFWVELPRHRLRLEVPAHRSLLDVLNDAGVETLFDCRRGECGLCAVDIVRAEGVVDHRDVFFSADQKQTNRQLCACVSRVSGGGVVIDSAYRPQT